MGLLFQNRAHPCKSEFSTNQHMFSKTIFQQFIISPLLESQNSSTTYKSYFYFFSEKSPTRISWTLV
ncbi:MAG TPA: hypothetical protein DCS93_17020 [Microscillaceae bacterium]|nr:hypothetical protein [Microscillaceae bacterium]